jgi:hypothetical protein
MDDSTRELFEELFLKTYRERLVEFAAYKGSCQTFEEIVSAHQQGALPWPVSFYYPESYLGFIRLLETSEFDISGNKLEILKSALRLGTRLLGKSHHMQTDDPYEMLHNSVHILTGELKRSGIAKPRPS